MLKWKWLICTYTFLDFCRHLCSKLHSAMTASVTLFCSLHAKHPTIHTDMWSVLLLLPLQSQVYEEIMRMFTTITVEAGNAAYSQSATDDRKSQYRWMLFFVFLCMIWCSNLMDRWCHWNFLLTLSFRPHYGPGVNSASNRNEYPEYFLGGKGGRCVRLTTLPPSCAECLEIWEPQPPGTLRACPGM
jgi:hypothetical protein